MKKHFNEIIIIISVSLLIFPLLFFQHINKITDVNSYKLTDKPTIIIDAGHGGEDGGAVSVTGTLEKDLNLKIAKKLNAFLTSAGYRTKMTRENDRLVLNDSDQYSKHLDLQNRVDIFNSSQNNIAISIHQNKFTESQYYGTQIFYSANNEKSEILAENIKNSVVNLLQNDNTRECKKAGSEILVLNKSSVPTVLVECGFLSNETEAKLLEDEEYQNKIAYSIFLGILEFENTKIRND